MDNKLYENRRECILHALHRNLEWAKRTNEITVQVRKWAIAFSLILFGFVVKENEPIIKWFHFVIGTGGLVFFLSLDIIQHYYSRLITDHSFILNRMMTELPKMTHDQLSELIPLPVGPAGLKGKESMVVKVTVSKKIRIVRSLIFQETIVLFYGGLFVMNIGILASLRIFG